MLLEGTRTAGHLHGTFQKGKIKPWSTDHDFSLLQPTTRFFWCACTQSDHGLP